MNGIALTILVSQLPKLMGFSVDANDVVGGIVGLVRGIADGEIVPLALAIGLVSLAVILGPASAISRRIPGVLVAVVAAGVVVYVFGLQSQVKVVGEVPRGLPAIGLPGVSWSDLVTLFPTALGIALISFADTSVISHSFAARRGERVDADHELAALGVVNVAAGLVGGFASSGSATRTPVAESAGSKTQVTGLVGAGAIVLLLVAVPGLLAPVPTAALAAVVISAVLSLVDIWGLRRLWQLAPVGARPRPGRVPGRRALRCSARASPRRSASRSSTSSGTPGGRTTPSWAASPNYKGYHDIGRHPEARLVPGPHPLPLGRAALLRQRGALPRARPRDVDHAPPPIRWLAVASEPMTDIDTTAADTLEELITELARRGVELHFAEHEGPREGPPADLRDLPAAGRGPLPPDGRERGEGLPGDATRRGVA